MCTKKNLFLVIFVLICINSRIFAGGYEGVGLGSRALSMGGAFIGVADDWTSAYWNPAGLVNLKKPGMGFTVDAVTVKAKDSNSAANPAFGSAEHLQGSKYDLFYKFDPNEPTEFNKKEITTKTYLPGIGFYTPTKIGTFEICVYNPVGYAAKWEDKVSNVEASYEQELYILVYNISYGNEISSKLSGGVGINFLQGKNKLSASKNTTDFDLDLSADGTGIEGIVGLLYKPNDKVSCGAVYRSGSNIELKGDAKGQGMVMSPPLINAPTVVQESSDFKQKVRHPQTFGIGIAHHPNEKTIISFDWQRTLWDELRKDVEFDTPGNFFLTNQDESYNWKDTDRYRIGTEYKLEPKMALRAGFFLDPLAPPKESLNVTNILNIGKKEISFGFGYLYNEQLNIDLTYLYAWGEEKYKTVKYSQYVNSIQLALNYNF